MSHLQKSALRRCWAEVSHGAATGLLANITYFDWDVLEAMRPQSGRVQPSSTSSKTFNLMQVATRSTAETDVPADRRSCLQFELSPMPSYRAVKARLLWAERDMTGCVLRLLFAIAPTTAIGCMFMFC